MAVLQGCQAEVQVEDPANIGTFLPIGSASSYSYEESSNNETYFVLGNCDAITSSTSVERSFSLEGLFEIADVGQTTFDVGQQRKFRIFPEGSSSATTYIEFDAVLETISRGGTAGTEFQTFSLSASVTGTPTESNIWS